MELEQRAARLAPEQRCMEVVVALDPRICREAVGGALRVLRPHLEVVVASPEEIGYEAEHLQDVLVVCSRQSPITDGGPIWVEYRAYDGKSAKICVGGRCPEIGEMMGLKDLLQVIDETERRARADSANPWSRTATRRPAVSKDPAIARYAKGKPELEDGIILLVDDKPRNADLFIHVLRMSGFANEVIVARDGLEALDYLFGTGEHAGRGTRYMPRLVLLDLNMPRMDGLEALRRIRADERTRLLPVVMFSASNMREEIAEAYRLGANGFIDKLSLSLPYPELVKETVHYWLVVNEQPPVPARR